MQITTASNVMISVSMLSDHRSEDTEGQQRER